ncbi:MAG: hypothetical protein ACWA5R_03140, partial [bacterium]
WNSTVDRPRSSSCKTQASRSGTRHPVLAGCGRKVGQQARASVAQDFAYGTRTEMLSLVTSKTDHPYRCN